MGNKKYKINWKNIDNFVAELKKFYDKFGTSDYQNFVSSKKSNLESQIEKRIGEKLGSYIQRQYKEKPLYQIAEDLGVSFKTVRYWAKNHDIDIKNGKRCKEKSDLMIMAETKCGEPIEEYLHREYLDNSKTYSEIARGLNVGNYLVSNWCKKFGIEKIEKNSPFKSLDYCIKFANKIKKENGLESLPSQDGLKDLGYTTFGKYLMVVHGGFPKFRKLLGEKPKRRYRLFADMSDNDFIEFIKQNYKGMSTSELRKKDVGTLQRIYKNGLLEKLNNFNIIASGKRANGFFKKMSNDELVSFVTENYRGYTILDIEGKDHTALANVRHRGLLENLVETGVLIRVNSFRKYTSMTNNELIEYASKNYKGKTISEVEYNGGAGFIHFIRRKKLLDTFVKKGILIRAYSKINRFKDISDKNFINYLRKNYKGSTLTELAHKHKSIYRIIKSRGLDDELVNKNIIIRNGTANGKFSKMTDEELIEFVKENYNGKRIVDLQIGHNRVYELVRKKKFIDKLVNEGILIRLRPDYSQKPAALEELLINYAGEKDE